MLFCPCHCFFIFFVVIDTFFHAADDFCQVDRLITHSQVFLEEIRINDRTGNTHRYATHWQVRFSSHCSYCLCGACKTKNFFRYIFGNAVIVQILYVMSINAECRKSFLCVSCQYCCKIYCSRTLCSIESPYSFRVMRVHIHSFRTVAPARSYGNSRTYTFSFELFSTGCAFSNTADSAIGNHAFHRASVTVFQITAN